MKAHWTDTVEGHLVSIYAYIALDSIEYAKRMADRLTCRSQQISDSQLSGRRVPEYDADHIRQVIEGPYRIIYHIEPGRVEVVAVIHGAMDVLRSGDLEAD